MTGFETICAGVASLPRASWRRSAALVAPLIALAVLTAASEAAAEMAMSGTFTATAACQAMQSIRKGTNPGGVVTAPGAVYDLRAKNKPEATYYRIAIDGAVPAERWVAATCGEVLVGAGLARAGDMARATGAQATHVLAMGWEPAFCAKHADKAECQAMTAHSASATQLSLHGLWPQPRGTQYCNVAPDIVQQDRDHNWAGLPEPELSGPTLARLGAVMPGVQSKLQRHEWIVHGTCFGGTAEGYFTRAAELAEAIDGSSVSRLFAANAGQTVSAAQIRAAFDAAFGAGAGERVAISCNGRGGSRKVTEIVINLAGDVRGSAPLGDLIRAAPSVAPGCPGGLIAAAP